MCAGGEDAAGSSSLFDKRAFSLPDWEQVNKKIE